MDPKIQEIMNKLNKVDTQVSTVPEEKPKTPEFKPPTTYEEFLAAEHLDEWPQRLTSENLLNLDEERGSFGNQEDIYQMLKDATPIDLHILNDFDERLQRFDETLHKYASMILDNKKLPLGMIEAPPESDREKREEEEGEKEGEEDDEDTPEQEAFLTDVKDSDLMKTSKKKPMDFKDNILESRKKNVNNHNFPGYRYGELTELPGQLEAPQILHRVTKAQDFNPGFRKFWKKIFQSEASIAIMQDSFWWIFIEKFESDKRDDQSKLFDRIADSFVALFNSVNPEIKDKVFSVYADCLAQSIFASFHEAFPESDDRFQGLFKQEVADLCYEWVSGIKAPVGVWKKWNSKRLEPKQHRNTDDGKNKASNISLNKQVKYSLDMDDFNRTVDRLGEHGTGNMGPGISREPTKLTTNTYHTTGTYPSTFPSISPSRQAMCGTPKKEIQEPTAAHSKIAFVPAIKVKDVDEVSIEVIDLEEDQKPTKDQGPQPTKEPKRRKYRSSRLIPIAGLPLDESCEMGPGPEMERSLFNLSGQSPLVAHYLHMRQLRTNKPAGKKVRRTEITKPQESGRQTYRQLINDTLQTSNKLSKEYQSICEETEAEIQKINKKQQETNRKINKLQREIMFCKNSLEIKIMSERILDKQDGFEPQRLQAIKQAGEDEDEDEEY